MFDFGGMGGGGGFGDIGAWFSKLMAADPATLSGGAEKMAGLMDPAMFLQGLPGFGGTPDGFDAMVNGAQDATPFPLSGGSVRPQLGASATLPTPPAAAAGKTTAPLTPEQMTELMKMRQNPGRQQPQQMSAPGAVAPRNGPNNISLTGIPGTQNIDRATLANILYRR